MKKITIEVDQEGGIRIETHNFVGAECEKATKFIEEALGGGEPTKKGRKSEYYAQRTNLNRQST